MDSATPGFDDDPPPEPRDGWLLVRIHVPELNVYKCLQFPSDRMVWDVKQQVLASLPKELKESFNYGLFCPPSNGKAGKFLDEERRLGDYPFNGPVGYLELKYKRRVYKMLNLDERQLKALHTRANLRRFLECINGGHVEKIAKMCAKGLDPNFHCPDSGETPLTVATGAKKPNKLLIALVNGGALLDYRTKDGATALHKAVEKDSLEAVTTLLELGASPNYKDGRGITPLYISITRKCDPKITESLLHDHAALGIQDNQGWQEVHQACRHGLVHHLEHLLFYGADMDGRNASGNTPLHVCAVNNQEACARMLLFRGAQRGALNYANQTPYQVAVIAGNLELAEMIQNYKSDDVVPFRGPPRYNPKRRSGIGWLNANGGVCVGVGCGTLTRNGSACGGHHGHGPPSPCPSEHMPYSSASSSLSEGSSGHRSHEDDISIVTDKSLGDTSDIISDSSGVGTNSDSAACSIGHPSTTVVCMEPYAGTAVGHIRLQPGDVIEVVGSTDCGLLEGYVRGSNQAGFFPADCVQEVNLRQKNITNVSTAGPNHSQSSPFLQQQQQHQNSSAASGSSGLQGSPQLSLGGGSSGGGSGVGIGIGGTLPRQAMSQHQHHQQHQQQQQQQQHHQQSPSLSMNSNGSSQALNGGGGGGGSGANGSGSGGGGNGGGPQQYSSATAPRMKKTSFNEPRNVILHRAKRGFGFILRGAKASSPLMQLKPSDRFPALQYLDDVDPGGVADMAGLRPGDFLLSIGGEDVRAASHEKVVEMIRSAGALVSMTVISPQFPPHNQMNQAANASSIGHQFLPGLGGGGHLSSGPSTPQTSHRQCATLPRKMSLGPGGGGGGGGGNGGNGGNIGRMPAPMPPRRDPKTTLSVGRARAKSMVAGLENGGERDHDEHPGPPHHHQPHHQQLHLHHQQQQQLHHQHGDGHSTHTTKSSSVESIATATPTPTPTSTHPGTPVQLRTASIKARPTSSRITAAELEELFQRQQGEAGTGGDGDGEGEGSNRYSTMMTTSRFQSGTDSGAATPPATGHGSPLKGPLVYSSVSEMKRKTMSKAKNGGGSATGTLRGKPCAIPTVGGRDLKRFHSTPDLMAHAAGSASSTSGSASSIWTASGAVGRKGHHSQDDVATLHASMQRLNLPPPSHPPPPPPVGQVVKVETRPGTGTSTSTPGSEYESTLTLQQKLKKRAEAEGVASATIDGVQSSFNPAASAKIYASPQELRNVMAWKLRQSQVQEQSRQPQSGQNGQQQQSNSQQQLPASSAAAPPPPPPMQQQQQQQQPQPNSQYAQPTTMRARSQSLSLTKSPPASQSHYAPSQQQQQHQSQQQNGNNNNQNSTTASGGNNHNNNISSVNNISLNNISLVSSMSSMSSNSSNNNNTLPAGPAPPIPEPDYSLSESDGEDENSILVARNTKLNEKIALIDVPETSGNSQTSAGSNSSASGSASGSGSISHSLSVDEIQRIRSNLKTSKSYPNGLLKQGGGEASSANGERAADNSSNNNGHGKEVAAAAANNNELPNDEEADNSSSGVSSDQDVVAAAAAAATAPRPTDTIKKKPSVTIVEEPKTIPDKKEATEGGVPSAAPATTATTPSTAAGSAAPASATTTTTTTTSTSTTAKGGHGVLVTIGSASPATAVATTTTSASTSVASTAAAFEAKATATATTVTVKQMVQQQHAPVIQQQQQQLHQQTQQTQVALAASKVKTLVVQSQQLGPKAQPAMAGRIAGASTTATPPQAQHLHPNQKLLAAQAQILLQQQQQQHHLHQQQQQQQQQLAHQQHLQQILKAKAALGPSATAAIVASRQQELANSDPTTESEHEQRSDDDGELSPSPPAKAFQRHNSLTRKQAAAIAMQRATRSTAAVSLVQLPPPIEADSGDEMSMPMPMSGSASSSVLSAPVVGRAAMAMAMEMCPENIVLAPPPQFCDCNDIKQQQHQHHHHPPQHHHQQQQQLHHHQQQQQQHLQLQQQQHQQQALAMSMHAHMMHGGGSNGRVRIVGTVPKTTHHRLH